MSRVRFLDHDWYVTTRRYENEGQARAAFVTLQDRSEAKSGALGLGVYRHGPAHGALTFITVVGLDEGNVDIARQILGGEAITLDRANVQALIARRVRVMAELVGRNAAPGSYEVPHERGGAHMHRDGTMEDDDA